MEQVRAVLSQVQHAWRSSPASARLTIIVGSAIGMVALALVLTWGSRSSFTPLMTQLGPQDTAEIAARLARENVPHQIAAGGTAILVPHDRVHALRLRLAGDGLPRGGSVGFEIFDEPAIGMSRFAEKLNYRRAIEGELQRTIRSMDAVRDARVHVVLPKRSLFEDRDEEARASVTLHLHPGRRLSSEQVTAVTHLLASSVAGLAPDDVTVIDGAGRVLARGGDDMASLVTNLGHQQGIERRLERRATEILARIVGEGRAEVRVNATLDFTQTEQTTESYDPDSAVVRSEQTLEETRSRARTRAAGIRRARTNLAGTTVKPAGGAGADGGTRRTQTRNYEVNKTVSREVRSLGRVARLSVAVLVDGVRATADDGTTSYHPRSDEELQRLAALVRSAVGFDASRGDRVEVQSSPFVPIPASEAPPGVPGWLPILERLWRPGVVLLLVAAALAWLVRRARRAQTSPQPMLSPPRTVRELEAEMEQQRRLGSAPTPAALGAGRPDAAQVTSVLKSWLTEA